MIKYCFLVAFLFLATCAFAVPAKDDTKLEHQIDHAATLGDADAGMEYEINEDEPLGESMTDMSVRARKKRRRRRRVKKICTFCKVKKKCFPCKRKYCRKRRCIKVKVCKRVPCRKY